MIQTKKPKQTKAQLLVKDPDKRQRTRSKTLYGASVDEVFNRAIGAMGRKK